MSDDARFEIGYTRVVYRRLVRNLFRITEWNSEGKRQSPDGEFGFKAWHIIGPLWWVDLKSFEEYVKKYDGFGTFDVFTPYPTK